MNILVGDQAVCELPSLLVREDSNFSQLIKLIHESFEQTLGPFLVLLLLFGVI